MDEIMKHDAVQPVEESTEPEIETAAEQKPQSLKAARTALKRMESDLEKKTEQIAALRKEITELKPQIRDMKAQIEILEQEETLKKVQDGRAMCQMESCLTRYGPCFIVLLVTLPAWFTSDRSGLTSTHHPTTAHRAYAQSMA